MLELFKMTALFLLLILFVSLGAMLIIALLIQLYYLLNPEERPDRLITLSLKKTTHSDEQ